MALVRIQSPRPEHPPALSHTAQTITVGDNSYRFIPGQTLDAAPEDAKWITENVPGWTMVGPVEGGV